MHEALRLQQSGLTHKAIASRLGVHTSTVGDYLASMRYRVDLDSSDNSRAVISGSNFGAYASTGSAGGHDGANNGPNTGDENFEKPIWPHLDVWSKPEICDAAWQKTPGSSGLYRWFLSGQLPSDFEWPNHLEPLTQGKLLYVGRADNLRKRAKHHRLPTSGSSLRRTLASLLGYPAIWVGKSAHPRISDEHHEKLSQWMSQNLEMSFEVISPGSDLIAEEKVLRKASGAPLNKDGLTESQEYVFSVGKLWLANAMDHRPEIPV